jgi:hypothetical protein
MIIYGTAFFRELIGINMSSTLSCDISASLNRQTVERERRLMDRALWQRHMEQAERDVAEANRHIARQQEIIAELYERGQDTQSERDLLAQFESLFAIHTAHRDRLRTELGDIPPATSRV